MKFLPRLAEEILSPRFGGLHSVKVIGRRATREEAPILVVAPHSTFFDALAALWDDDRHNRETPYIVSRAENLRAPLLGKILKFAQAVSVSREDPESRQRAKLGSVQESFCVSVFQYAATVEHSEKCAISSEFAFQSSILMCSKRVANEE